MTTRFTLTRSLALKLATRLGLVIVVTLPPYFLYEDHQERKGRFRTFEAHGRAVGEAIRVGLEDGMLRNDFRTLDEMVATLARSPGVERVAVLGRAGTVKVCSDSALVGRHWALDEPGCVECHRHGESPKRSSLVLASEGTARRFRTVTAIPNRAACHGCHDPAQRTNGVLLVDLSMADFDRQMWDATRRRFVSAAGTTSLVLALAGWLIHRLVIDRLARIRRAVEAAGPDGTLGRIGSNGEDEIGILEGALEDMSRRVASALAELRRQRRTLEDLVDSIEDEIMAIDPEGRIVMVNRALAHRLGRDKASCLGRPCFEVTQCKNHEGRDCPSLHSFVTGRMERSLDRRPAAEGGTRVVEVHSFPVRDEGERIVQVVEVARDISHRARLEAQLDHAERLALLGQLASGVAHEINNPIGTITTCTEGILARLADPAPGNLAVARDYLETIRRESFRCKSIVVNLLEFARSKAPHFDTHDLAAVVEQSLTLVEHRARSRGKRVTTHLDPALPKVWVDPDKVKQVVVNLVVNALDAVERGGTVQVHLAREGEAGPVLLEVRDDGCGIPTENLDRIFDPFFTTKPPGVGTGLGLTICRDIVRELGGTLEVSSRLGEGTTFRVRFPCAEARGG